MSRYHSRIVTGPVISADPSGIYRVTGEIQFPDLDIFTRYAQAQNMPVHKIAYGVQVTGDAWAEEGFRENLELQVRRAVADEFIDRFPIPLHAERYEW